MDSKIKLTLPFNRDLAIFLKSKYGAIPYRIISKNFDPRGANRGKAPVYHYEIEFSSDNLKEESSSQSKDLSGTKFRPIIVGMGPAGIFAAIMFLEHGIKSIILERGSPVDVRMKEISKFWRYGIFSDETNVCYGEGGAGLFSDGKLLTRVKSKYLDFFLEKLVFFGAPDEIRYLNHPHVGSNRLRAIIKNIASYLKNSGCEIHYDSKVDSFLVDGKRVVGVKLRDGREINSDAIVLSTGHSAKDVYSNLIANGVEIKAKDFAVGFRIEHERKYIDELQYGPFSKNPHNLSGASYRVSSHDDSSGRGFYSFCMCPGGVVLSSGSESDGLVTNGMSNQSRNSHWSNAALVASVKRGIDFIDNPTNAILFQKEIEKKAYCLSKEFATGRELPAISIREFLDGKVKEGSVLKKTSCPSGIFKSSFDEIFPNELIKFMRNKILDFDRSIKGFIKNDAILIAPETRTSSPVTIVRDKETLKSVSHDGLYPCGEGAGYAGGITSSAIDGINVAKSIVRAKFG